MKWFGVDSDTPNDPKIRALLVNGGKKSNLHAQARMGGLFLVWCHIADHGAQPGRGISADGSPMDLQEIADACYFDSIERLMELLDFCAARRHIDPIAWAERREIFFPAMAKRADEYTKKVQRRAAKSGDSPEPVRPMSGHPAPSAVSSPESPVCTVGPVGVVSSSSDHIVPTEERESARARAVSGSGVMAGALPREHLRHVQPCGRVCVPEVLHGALIRQLGGDPDAAATTLRAFYRRTLDSIPADQPIGDEPFDFWRKHFAAVFPSAAPAKSGHAGKAAAAARGNAFVHPDDVDAFASIGLRDDDAE